MVRRRRGARETRPAPHQHRRRSPMPTHLYTTRPLTVKSGLARDRAALHNPWVLLDELRNAQKAAPWLDTAEYAERFLVLVAACQNEQERDALIVAGWTPFQYGLADALARVQHHRLQQMRRVL